MRFENERVRLSISDKIAGTIYINVTLKEGKRPSLFMSYYNFKLEGMEVGNLVYKHER